VSEFTEPTSLEDANARRVSLIAEKSACIGRLQGANETRRANIVRRLTSMDAELGFLKAWITSRRDEEFRENLRWGVVGDGAARLAEFDRAADGLREYVKFLERENAELKARLEALEKEELEF
jgi:hypothetical protein